MAHMTAGSLVRCVCACISVSVCASVLLVCAPSACEQCMPACRTLFLTRCNAYVSLSPAALPTVYIFSCRHSCWLAARTPQRLRASFCLLSHVLLPCAACLCSLSVASGWCVKEARSSSAAQSCCQFLSICTTRASGGGRVGHAGHCSRAHRVLSTLACAAERAALVRTATSCFTVAFPMPGAGCCICACWRGPVCFAHCTAALPTAPGSRIVWWRRA